MMKPDDGYTECLQTMFGLRRFGIKLGLGTIRQILNGLDNPQNRFHCIHVAGTNGKGSVAATLASILTSAGYKTGLYTSPHLVRFNERIVVNNQPISDKGVVEAYRAVKQVHHGSREPTFFEFTTAMALYEFERQRVDWAVIETGMGGRLDATNIIRPQLSIITNISLEHREYLGNTIREIAGEKAGIIKRSTPVVTAVSQKAAKDVLVRAAARHSAPLFQYGRHFKVRRNAYQTFNYYGIDTTWRKLQTPLLGSHQITNAALALAASEVLNRHQTSIQLDNIKMGLRNTCWPGRLEMASTKPLILLDGAHNLVAARQLAAYLRDAMSNLDITLVIGILDDKPYQAMLRDLVSTASRVILTQPKIDRGLSPDILAESVRPMTPNVKVIPDVAQAVEHAVKTVGPQDAICIAGSLYVVGEAKQALNRILSTA